MFSHDRIGKASSINRGDELLMRKGKDEKMKKIDTRRKIDTTHDSGVAPFTL